MRSTNPGSEAVESGTNAVYRIGFSEASPWLAPGTVVLLWFLGLLAHGSVSTSRLVVWMAGSVLWPVLRHLMIEHFGERGRMVRPVVMAGVFGCWIVWYWIGLAPVDDQLLMAFTMLGITTWWTASTALLAGNPIAFGLLTGLMVTGPLVSEQIHPSPFHHTIWLLLFLAAVIVMTYWDRRLAFLAALDADKSVRQFADEFSLVFESVRDGVMVSVGGEVTRANASMGSQLRRELDEVVGRRVEEVLGRDPEEILSSGSMRLVADRPDGSTVVLEVSGRINRAEDVTVWSSRDVTDVVTREAELEAMIAHDELTGLANRRSIFEHLEALHRAGTPTAVLAVDVDGFKDINDRYGHAAGDEVLRVVAARLDRMTGSQGLVARLGGDEFVVVLGCQSAVAERRALAADLVEAARAPFPLVGGEVTVTLSVGVSTSDGSVDPELLLQEADAAMYEVKRSGRDGWKVHAKKSGPDGVSVITPWRPDLRRAGSA